jgi:hypothetical protein
MADRPKGMPATSSRTPASPRNPRRRQWKRRGEPAQQLTVLIDRLALAVLPLAEHLVWRASSRAKQRRRWPEIYDRFAAQRGTSVTRPMLIERMLRVARFDGAELGALVGLGVLESVLPPPPPLAQAMAGTGLPRLPYCPSLVAAMAGLTARGPRWGSPWGTRWLLWR